MTSALTKPALGETQAGEVWLTLDEVLYLPMLGYYEAYSTMSLLSVKHLL